MSQQANAAKAAITTLLWQNFRTPRWRSQTPLKLLISGLRYVQEREIDPLDYHFLRRFWPENPKIWMNYPYPYQHSSRAQCGYVLFPAEISGILTLRKSNKTPTSRRFKFPYLGQLSTFQFFTTFSELRFGADNTATFRLSLTYCSFLKEQAGTHSL